MERVVHKAGSVEETADREVQQQVAMSPQERMRIARVLKRRAYPADAKDVRECHRECEPAAAHQGMSGTVADQADVLPDSKPSANRS